MKKYAANTPEGTRDRLYAECLERRRVQSRLTELFRKRGYSEVITPEVEYYDLFIRSGDPLPQESMMKIVDRSGKLLVMRPDCTTPIARVAATKLKGEALPQRLYYNQTVFRSDAAHVGTDSEIAQCGVELIGASGRKADAEIIALAVEALTAAGVPDFRVELGHAGYFRALAADLGADEDTVERMRGLVESKNFAALEELLEPFGDRPSSAALRMLSRLFGGAEVLEEAGRLFGGAEAEEALCCLRAVYRELEAAGLESRIQFDLGMVHRLDYYTGIVFRGYAEGAGSVVISGGRYDNLLSAFGRPAPATGFAADVDALAGCIPAARMPRLETVIHFETGSLRAALDEQTTLPVGSCELSPRETEEESRALARQKGAARLVVLSAEGRREETL